MLKEEEILKGADDLMYQKAVPRFFGLFTGHEEPVYNIAVPDEYRQGMIDAVVKGGGNQPTEEQIRREFVRMQLKNLGKGTSSSKKDQSKVKSPTGALEGM